MSKVRHASMSMSLELTSSEKLSPRVPEWGADKVKERHLTRVRSILRAHGYKISKIEFALNSLEYVEKKKRSPREFKEREPQF